jgi:hypothetical protein
MHLVGGGGRRWPKTALILAVMSSAGLWLAGCGGTTTTTPMTGSAPVTVSLRDAPPAGVTILAFEITVTGAQLQPANSSQTAVSLLNTPVEVELKQLETETAFLNTAPAPPGTYSGITVSFANPEMTILDTTGQFCSGQAICKLHPTLNAATAAVSAPTAPFPLTLNANTPVGLVLDFDLNASVQSNLSVTPQISFTQVPALQPSGEFEKFEDMLGQVTAVGNNQFTLQEFFSGQSLTVAVTSSTQFEDFDEVGCTANNFSCLKVGQVVEVDLSLNSNGQFVAVKVNLEENPNEELAEGTVVSVNASQNTFNMVVLDEVPNIAGLGVGIPVTVTVQSGASFSINTDGVTLPAGVSFNGLSDLLPGQRVRLRVLSVASSGTGLAVTTDRVRLTHSQLTGTVATVAPPNFVVNQLSALFTTAGINQIQVQTSSATEFEGVTGVSGLTAGDRVALRGLLFKTASDPLLVALKVRKR